MGAKSVHGAFHFSSGIPSAISNHGTPAPQGPAHTSDLARFFGESRKTFGTCKTLLQHFPECCTFILMLHGASGAMILRAQLAIFEQFLAVSEVE